MYGSFLRSIGPLFLIVAAGAFVTGCTTVTATGEQHLNLVSQPQEIQMGREADQQIVASLGVYRHPALEKYVSGLGKRLAATTERPELPWTFRIVDDSSVNAFALPGGFIYVTRGILTTLNDEAELAGVLGHEIGHVTAQHQVIRVSEQQLAQLGLGIASVVAPGLQNYLPLAGMGLQLMFLKFSRDDESQADELGVRYMSGVGQDPNRMVAVMKTLEAVSTAGGGGAVPEWLATHPAPANREEALRAQIKTLGADGTRYAQVNRDGYLRLLDGVVYGKNPREGYSTGSAFFHPDMKFAFVFPQGWTIVNQKEAVIGVSPQQDAAVQISLAKEATVAAAAQGLFSQEGMSSPGSRRVTVNGFAAETGGFVAQTREGALQGQATFLAYGGKIYQIIGYSGQSNWPQYSEIVQSSLGSFKRLTDPKALAVQPMHLLIRRVAKSTTLKELNDRTPSGVPIAELALINGMQPETVLQAGQLVKLVTGVRVEQ